MKKPLLLLAFVPVFVFGQTHNDTINGVPVIAYLVLGIAVIASWVLLVYDVHCIKKYFCDKDKPESEEKEKKQS